MFAIKMLGISLIVTASAVTGFLKSSSLTARCKKLSVVCEGADALYEYIDQGGCELDTAIKNAFSKCDFLNFKNGKIFCCDGDLKSEDKSVISDFFSSLGASAKKAECDRIINFKLKMKTHLKQAQNDEIQKSKIYRVLGICTGLTVGILLI